MIDPVKCTYRGKFISWRDIYNDIARTDVKVDSTITSLEPSFYNESYHLICEKRSNQNER